MNVISQITYEFRDKLFNEFAIKLDNDKVVYLNILTKDIKNNIDFDKTELHIYNRPFLEILHEPEKCDYYNCNIDEAKELYNLCLNNINKDKN